MIDFQNVKEWRERHGMTQREAGAIFGWSQPAWHWRENETGQTEGGTELLFQMSLKYLDEHPELIQKARIQLAESIAAEADEMPVTPKGLRPAGKKVWEMANEQKGRKIKMSEVPQAIHHGAYELVGRKFATFTGGEGKPLWLILE